MTYHALRGRTRYPGLIDRKIKQSYLFIDSFESGTSLWDAYINSVYASISTSTAQHYDKSTALYVQNTEVADRYAAIRTNKLLNYKYNYGSIYIQPAPDEQNRTEKGFNKQIIWYSSTDTIGTANVQVGILYDANRKLSLVVGTTVQDSYDYALPLNAWVNIQWAVYIDSTNGYAKVRLGDSQILTFTGNTDPKGIDKLGYFWIGSNQGGTLNGQGYRRLYMDYLTIS